MSDQLFLAEVRAALRIEMAGVRVGVAAPQLRGRIVARERDRHRRRLRVAAAAVAIAGVVVALPVVAGLVIPATIGPSPGGVQPASVAAIDPERGDLVLSWAWPDGHGQAGERYPGALALLHRTTGDGSPDRLPGGAVLTPGPDGRLAVALPTGHILVYRSPGSRGIVTRVVDGAMEETWLGWAEDGRLVAIGRPFAAPDARLRLRIVDPDTGGSVEGTLRYGTSPLASGALLTWTDQGTILAQHRDPRTGATTIGSLSVAGGRATFDPGLPARVRVTTGLEPALARDGSVARGWSDDGDPGWSSVGIGSATDGDALAARWYTAGSGERIFDVVRSADLLRLVALVGKADGTSVRVVVVDWPGTWRDAVVLPDADGERPSDPGPGVADDAEVVGLAPDGRTIAVDRGGALVIADLATGTTVGLPPGTAFLGWPEPTVAVVESVPTAPACVAAVGGDGRVDRAGGGRHRGTRGPRHAPRRRRPCRSGPVAARSARARGGCRRRRGRAARPGAPGGGVRRRVPGRCDRDRVRAGRRGHRARRAGTRRRQPATGLLELVAPPAGDWIVRVTLWLAGADREAILLYRVRTAGP